MKRMIKTALSICIAASLTLSAAACGSADTSETGAEAAGNAAAGTLPAETDAAMEFSASDYSIIDYSEDVTLGEHTGLEIAVDPLPDPDELVQENIDGILSAHSATVMVASGVTQVGDTITLNYTGYLDGEPFENGSAEGATYRVGSGRFISDLDEQLAGLTVGETYELPCTFPEDYHSAELAGKEVVFEVTVTAIAGESNTPEWTDEFVAEYTQGDFTTTEDFEAFMRDGLSGRAVAEQHEAYLSSLWSTVMANCEIREVPQDQVESGTDYYIEALRGYYEMEAYTYGMSYDDLMAMYGATQEDMDAYAAELAEEEVKNFMVANMICQEEGLELTQENYSELIRHNFEESGYPDFDTFVEAHGGERYTVDSCLYAMALQWLEAHNTMVVSSSPETSAETSAS